MACVHSDDDGRRRHGQRPCEFCGMARGLLFASPPEVSIAGVAYTDNFVGELQARQRAHGTFVDTFLDSRRLHAQCRG